MRKFATSLKRKIIDPFRSRIHSPPYLALSTAVGIGFGLLPMFGQAYLCFLLWLVLRRWKATRFSLVISCAWTFISNPFTTPFFAYGFYIAGQKMLGGSAMTFSLFLERAKALFAEDSSLGSLLKNSFDFIAGDIGLPVMIGSLAAIAVAAPAAYAASYALASRMEKRRKAARRKKRSQTAQDSAPCAASSALPAKKLPETGRG